MAATVAAFAVLVGVIALVNSTSGPSAANFDVAVTSCDGTSSTASVGFTVTNKGDETRDATVRIEYRDGAGARLDTDTSYVRNVRPGDTVRAEESTLLDAPPDGTLRCSITGIS